MYTPRDLPNTLVQSSAKSESLSGRKTLSRRSETLDAAFESRIQEPTLRLDHWWGDGLPRCGGALQRIGQNLGIFEVAELTVQLKLAHCSL